MPGNYTDWRNTLIAERDQKNIKSDRAKQLQKDANRNAQAKPGNKPGVAKGAQNKPKVRNPWAFEKLEQTIEKLESQRDRMLAEMQKEAIYKDASKLSGLQYDLAEVERDLGQKNDEWANWG